MSRLVLVAFALSAMAVPVAGVVGPLPSASATAIDCSYDPGLSAFIGKGRDGITCLGAAAGGGGGTTSGGHSGGSHPGGGGGSGCTPDTTNIPDGFFDLLNSEFAEVKAAYVDEFRDPSGVLWAHTQRLSWHKPISGGIVFRSQIDIFQSAGRYILAYNLFTSGHMQRAVYDSQVGCAGFDYEIDPEGQTEPSDLLGPDVDGFGLRADDQAGPVTTRGAMTPVPGRADTYFLRVDLTNDGGATAVPVNAELTFGYAFDLSSIAAVTSGTKCDVVFESVERCTVPELAPDQTATLTFVVTAKPGVAADATLPLNVSSLGTVKMFLNDNPAPSYVLSSIANSFLAHRPAAVVAPKAATTPECRYAGPVAPTVIGAEATGGARGTETVIAGVQTPLSTFCSNTNSLPMSVSAQHGSVSIEGHGALSYTAEPGFTGRDTISVVTTNPETGLTSAPAAFEVNVVAAPIVADDHYEVAVSGTPLEYTATSVLDNDQAPLTEGWMIQQGTTPPAHGTVTLDTRTGTFRYTPTAGYTGTDSFKYRLTGPHGSVSNVATVTLTVTAG